MIYLSTFSKSLAPSIRIACMVLPPDLLARYRETYGAYANTVSRFEQQTLCRFLRDGHFTRHSPGCETPTNPGWRPCARPWRASSAGSGWP